MLHETSTFEATLLRPRLVGADGIPHIETPDDPDTWRDGTPELVAIGRGSFSVVRPDDAATVAQIRGESGPMALRATFEAFAGCPQPRSGDTVAVEAGPMAVAFEVVVAGADLQQVEAGWTPLIHDGPAPGELVLELRDEIGVVA